MSPKVKRGSVSADQKSHIEKMPQEQKLTGVSPKNQRDAPKRQIDATKHYCTKKSSKVSRTKFGRKLVLQLVNIASKSTQNKDSNSNPKTVM